MTYDMKTRNPNDDTLGPKPIDDTEGTLVFRAHVITHEHVYVRVFCGPKGQRTPALLGHLVMRKNEFEMFSRCFDAEYIVDRS